MREQPSEESRTFLLDNESRIRLIEFGRNSGSVSSDEIYTILPSGMSQDEVSDVGLQVSCLAENINPSWDGLKNGRKAEVDTLFGIGLIAIDNSDHITAVNVIRHLRADRFDISRRVSAFMLSRALKKQNQD